MTISSIEKGRKIEYYGKEKELSNVSYKLYECISDFYRSCINMHKAYDKDNKHKNIHQILYKYVKPVSYTHLDVYKRQGFIWWHYG